MGFGQKYLKLKELMRIRNLPFCQELSKKIFLQNSNTLMERSISDNKTPVLSYEHICLMKHLLAQGDLKSIHTRIKVLTIFTPLIKKSYQMFSMLI